MRRIAVLAGLALGWAGLFLTWLTWTSFSATGTKTGSDLDAAGAFRLGLIAVTAIALVYAYKLWSAASVVLTVAALALLGLAVHAGLIIARTASTFVDVSPGLGLALSAAGAVVLVIAAKPRLYAFAAGLVPLLILTVWSSGTDRPAPGHAAVAVDTVMGTTLALDGDTILQATPTGAYSVAAADPDGRTFRQVFDTFDIRSGFSESVVAMERVGDSLYVNLGHHAIWRLPADGRPRMVALGPVRNLEDAPPRGTQRIAGFRPSRLAGAPDGSLYVLSDERVLRYDGKRFTPVRTPPLSHPQDIAVDAHNRLYIADTGNGRVLRGSEPLIGASAPAGCGDRGLDEPASLDPTHCHAIESLAVDAKGNLFLSTTGVPRVLALTTNGRFGVVAGTGVAGTALGDGRAVSAQVGGINDLAVGPDDDLYVGEYYRALRINDPVRGLNGRPQTAARGPAARCRALGEWGGATLAGDLSVGTPAPPLDAMLAAMKGVGGELGEALEKPYNRTQEHLESGASHTRNLLRAYGSEHCGLMDGLYPLDARQTMRFCSAYLREWAKLSELSPGDDRRRVVAERTVPLLGPELFPADAVRRPSWQSQLDQTARTACAVPYRWSTHSLD